MAAAKKAAATAEEHAPETADERAARKETETKTGPIAKPKKQNTKPQVGDLYSWAVNRHKVERAHVHVSKMGVTEENPAGDPALRNLKQGTDEFEQAVMDHYTQHGGLVRHQEKATVVGRKRIGNFEVGKTTSQVLGHEIDEEDGADRANDKDDD